MPERKAQQLAVGDAVLIRGRVTSVGEGGRVTIDVDPADLPGSPGYVQSIALHVLQAEAAPPRAGPEAPAGGDA